MFGKLRREFRLNSGDWPAVGSLGDCFENHVFSPIDPLLEIETRLAGRFSEGSRKGKFVFIKPQAGVLGIVGVDELFEMIFHRDHEERLAQCG